jgi:hypothetical protein
MKFVGNDNLTGERFLAVGMAGRFIEGPPNCTTSAFLDPPGRRRTKPDGLMGRCLLYVQRMHIKGPAFPAAKGHCPDIKKAAR